MYDFATRGHIPHLCSVCGCISAPTECLLAWQVVKDYNYVVDRFPQKMALLDNICAIIEATAANKDLLGLHKSIYTCSPEGTNGSATRIFTQNKMLLP